MHLRLLVVKILVIVLFFMPLFCLGQSYTETSLLSRLKTGGTITEDVLSKRSVVLHSHTFTPKEITIIHENLIRSGIDAIAYFAIDRVLAGGDVATSFSEYFVKREVAHIIIVQKAASGFTINLTAFNGKNDFANIDQNSWSTQSASLTEALNMVYRSALASNKKKNLLINEIPETDLPVRIIDGQRAENFAYDLKVDLLAVRKFNDATLDTALAGVLKMYPFRFQFVDPSVPERELRNKGFLYILCFVNTRNGTAKELLGYPVSMTESAFVSMTHPNGQMQLKTIAADSPVYKFYVRHIDSGNVFLGTKWDAETNWQQALQNYIKGFRIEMKIN